MWFAMMSRTEERVTRLLAYVRHQGEVTLYRWVHLTGLSQSTVDKLFTLATQASPNVVRKRGKLVWVGEKAEQAEEPSE